MIRLKSRSAPTAIKDVPDVPYWHIFANLLHINFNDDLRLNYDNLNLRVQNDGMFRCTYRKSTFIFVVISHLEELLRCFRGIPYRLAIILQRVIVIVDLPEWGNRTRPMATQKELQKCSDSYEIPSSSSPYYRFGCVPLLAHH